MENQAVLDLAEAMKYYILCVAREERHGSEGGYEMSTRNAERNFDALLNAALEAASLKGML